MSTVTEPIRRMSTPVGIRPSSASRTVFERQGFLGPLPVLTAWQCELFVRHLNRGAHVAPASLGKRSSDKRLFVLRHCYSAGYSSEYFGSCWERTSFSGEPACKAVQPRRIHPWHTDIETSRSRHALGFRLDRH